MSDLGPYSDFPHPEIMSVHFPTLDMCGGAWQYACEFPYVEVVGRSRAKIARAKIAIPVQCSPRTPADIGGL
jgi:hypothetical protein